MSNRVTYNSNLRQVLRDIDKKETKHRKEALKHVARKMRKNLNKRGVSSFGQYPGRRTGMLKKSIGFRARGPEKKTSIVGTKSKIAHLLEFGHGDGKERNKRPFISRTLQEEKDNIEKIMSTRYW